tara:strand:- start:1880 stop:2326 length:447 start_codon:yes stop_codon:yes gene_type:complete
MFKFLNKKEKLIFLSGIFEGEGTFGNFKAGLYRDGRVRRKIEISVEMTDRDVVDLFHTYFEKGNVYVRTFKNHYKTSFRWKVAGLEGLKILHLMLPYLCKRRQEQYYGMVQLIRDGGKDRSAYILQPTENKTSDVGCSTDACTKDGSR